MILLRNEATGDFFMYFIGQSTPVWTDSVNNATVYQDGEQYLDEYLLENAEFKVSEVRLHDLNETHE